MANPRVVTRNQYQQMTRSGDQWMNEKTPSDNSYNPYAGLSYAPTWGNAALQLLASPYASMTGNRNPFGVNPYTQTGRGTNRGGQYAAPRGQYAGQGFFLPIPANTPQRTPAQQPNQYLGQGVTLYSAMNQNRFRPNAFGGEAYSLNGGYYQSRGGRGNIVPTSADYAQLAFLYNAQAQKQAQQQTQTGVGGGTTDFFQPPPTTQQPWNPLDVIDSSVTWRVG